MPGGALPSLLRFKLSDRATLVLHDDDISVFAGDAVVCSTNQRMMGDRRSKLPPHLLVRYGGSGVAIHRRAGPALQEACNKVPEVEPGVRCPLAEARITPAGDLAARHVIHTVGPTYTFPEDSAPLLDRAYRSCLALANDHMLRSIAFPAISCGAKDYPPSEAAEIALRACREAAGELREVHFYLPFDLPGMRELAAWALEARRWLEELPLDGVLGSPSQPRRFCLGPDAQLVVRKGDIAEFSGDALVLAGDEDLVAIAWEELEALEKDGVFPRRYCGASASIHFKAGPALQRACMQVLEVKGQPLIRCPTGEARLTSAGKLSVRHVIHTAGPFYLSPEDSAPLLDRAYRSCLALANEHKLRSIAFPAVSCGSRGYPAQEAASIAVRACVEAVGGLQEITFFLPDANARSAWLAQAESCLKEVTPEAAAESEALAQLRRAAQQGSQQEVLELLAAWGARLGGEAAADHSSARSLAGLSLGSTATAPTPSAGSMEQRSAGSVSEGSTVTLPAGGQQAGIFVEGSAASLAGRSPEVDLRKWTYECCSLEKKRTLGRGSFGEVWLGVHQGTTFAVKQLFLTKPPPATCLGDDAGDDALLAEAAEPAVLTLSQPELRAFKEEAQLLAEVRHPHVLTFYGICLSPPCIVTEYCSSGSLYDALKAARAASPSAAPQLTWLRRLSLLGGVAKGMLALHSHCPPIIHRDLKSPNVLISPHFVAKVCDFNLSRFADDSTGARSHLSHVDGRNPRWLAPEVLEAMETSKTQPATKASDVFSFGMVMYEVLTWRLPWNKCFHEALIWAKVLQGERPEVEDLPGDDTATFGGLDAYQDLMRRCWAQDPGERPAFLEIVGSLKDMLLEQQRAMSKAAAAPGAG